MNALVAQALRDIEDAHRKLFGLIEQYYPVGTKVWWMHRGEYKQEGEVCYLHSFNYNQVQVRNDKSGKEQWLYIDRVRLI